MAITNIATLQAAVESWLERSFDDSLFLEWANAVADKLNNGVLDPTGRVWLNPPVRIRSMLTQTTLATSGGSASLPADWLEFERIWINANDGKDLLYLPLRQFRSHVDSQLTGTPTKYTIDGTTIFVAPTTDATLQISFYEKLGAFTGDSSTDAVLTNHPRVYLSGVLSEACDWIKDYDQSARELNKFNAAAHGLNAMEARASRSGSILMMRPQSVA